MKQILNIQYFHISQAKANLSERSNLLAGWELQVNRSVDLVLVQGMLFSVHLSTTGACLCGLEDSSIGQERSCRVL